MEAMTNRCCLWLTLLVTTHICDGHPSYQTKVPNGEIVPHPCKANNLWRGVGHKNLMGGGALNPFGADFRKNGLDWQAVCNMDSDGDGQTNGQELGDPGCTWTEGQEPSVKVGLSHPGICEPITDVNKCGPVPDWINCEKEDFVCDVLSEPETFNFTVRIPETPVPAKQTTYKCMFFEFPTDQEYHLVANTPYIDNEAVMHHIVVYGCAGDISGEEPLNTVLECGMGSGNRKCQDFIATWSVGIIGSCEHPHTGFLIGGLMGYKYASLQFHWNNPELRSGTTDSSGVNFFLTPKLRQYNAGVLLIGQMFLEIPPNELSINATGGCSSRCTEKFLFGNVNITSVFNHMHYLGKSQFTEIKRYGEKVETLSYDEVYNYDSPVVRNYETPIVAQPGDEFSTTCVFKSTSRTRTTYFGDETADEMCLSFLTFYPREKIKHNSCSSWGTIDICDLDDDVAQGCNFTKLRDFNDSYTMTTYKHIEEKCAITHCRKECKEYIKVLKATDPCYKGDPYRIRKSGYFGDGDHLSMEDLKFFTRVDSCDVQIALENNIQTCGISGVHASLLVCFVGLVMNFIP